MDSELTRQKNRDKVARWRAANPDRAREHAIRSALAAKERREASGQLNSRNVESRIKNEKRMTDAEWRAIQDARRAAREAWRQLSAEDRAERMRANVRERVRKHRAKQSAMKANRENADMAQARMRAEAKIIMRRQKREAARIARLAKKSPGLSGA